MRIPLAATSAAALMTLSVARAPAAVTAATETTVTPSTGHNHGFSNPPNEDARQLRNLTSKVLSALHVHGAWS
ncbi:hypothetical protein SAMN04487968_11515 [Nocardioides terrae]|uniref:Uncharacterized protein n=1 Tax=Nocardioides terrae TaxID=574651 RepID=A0A1I1N7G7_9ACTN|nr:hypothetical protein SAMN04487968_11515 [Nocardioides terrae]